MEAFGGEVYVISSYVNNNKNVVTKLYDSGSKKIISNEITNHKAYCLSPQSLQRLRNNNNLTNMIGHSHLEETKKYHPLTKKEMTLTKIEVTDPAIMTKNRKQNLKKYIKVYEANIPFHLSYLYDADLIPGIAYNIDGDNFEKSPINSGALCAEDLKVNFSGYDGSELDSIINWLNMLQQPIPKIPKIAFDIEAWDINGTSIPDLEKADQPVRAISFYGHDGLKTVLVLSDSTINADHETYNVIPFDNEKNLLLNSLTILDKYPLVVTFNGDRFDLLYILKRAINLGIPVSKIPIIKIDDKYTLRNGIHLDLFRFYGGRGTQNYIFNNRYKTKSLDAISKALIGQGKIDAPENFNSLTVKELASYCIRDSELTYNLTTFDDELVMKIIFTLSRLCKMGLEDVARAELTKWIESLLYYEHRIRNILILNSEDISRRPGFSVQTKAKTRSGKYKGATVLDPQPGVHFGVVILDFASMYPSIIDIWNLSYETIRCNHASCYKKKIPDTNHWVCTKKPGILSRTIKLLKDLRLLWFKPRASSDLSSGETSYNRAIEAALKVIINATYGAFAYPYFAFYCPPIAESIASLGRYALDKTKIKAKRLGLSVLGGDTDSVFLGNTDEKSLQELIKWVKNTLKLDLEIDKKYRYILLSSRKKNYLGVHPDGTIDTKGLIGIKKDRSEFMKRSFREIQSILREVETSDDIPMAITSIRDVKSRYKSALRDGGISLEDLAYRNELSKDIDSYRTEPEYVKAAKNLVKSGKSIGKGSIIAYVKTVNGPKDIDSATKNEIDVAKYSELLESMFNQILDAMSDGPDTNSVVGGGAFEGL